MNICFISSYPPPPTGIATYTPKLCSALAKNNVKVTVLSNAGNSNERGVRVMKVWSQDSFTYPLDLFKRVVSQGFNVVHIQHEYWLYGRGLRSLTFLLLLILMKFARKPIVVTMHCIIPRTSLTKGFFEKHGLGKRASFIKGLYVLLYNRLTCLLASRVIVHSNTAKNVLMNDYAFWRDKLVVIHHGTSLAECVPKDAMYNFTLLIFGEVRRGKGIEYCVKAMPEVLKSYPSCRLIVAGMYDADISPESKGYLDELKALVRGLALNDHVEFRINLLEEEVEALFSKASIAVFPYVEDDIIAASGPLSTAIGFGKPVVATKLRRFQEYLRDGENAILVRPSDPNNLAKAIVLLLNDRLLRERLSESARDLAESISWEKVAEKTLALYKELMKG